MASLIRCDICGRPLRPAGSYVVRMQIYAAPETDAMETEGKSDEDVATEWAKIMAELKSLTADEAQQQVHQAFEFRLCPSCRLAFIANPLGLPRTERAGNN